jgi:hypothetical protein
MWAVQTGKGPFAAEMQGCPFEMQAEFFLILLPKDRSEWRVALLHWNGRLI